MNVMTLKGLQKENMAFIGTSGRSEENRMDGLIPGFCDIETGEMYISCFKDGSPAPIHLLEGLPENWIKARDPLGKVLAIKDSVISGFFYRDHFYTREQAAMIKN